MPSLETSGLLIGIFLALGLFVKGYRDIRREMDTDLKRSRARRRQEIIAELEGENR